MRYVIKFLPQVQEEVRQLPPEIRRIVQAALDEICRNPYTGCPLVQELSGLWKYRARSYRIIYEIRPSLREIVVFIIGHRRSVYERLHELMKGRH